MKKTMLGMAAGATLLLGACAPTQGIRPTLYQGSSTEILATIGQVAPTIRPTGISNYFSVEAITPTTVALRATAVTGFRVLNILGGGRDSDASVLVTFTALQNGGVTSVTHSSNNFKASPEFINAIYAELDKRFPRVQQP